MTTDHQEIPASCSGLNRNTASRTRMAGLFPNSVRSVRSIAKHTAASSNRVTTQVSGQLYSETRASTQASAMPSGCRCPASSNIRYFQPNPDSRPPYR